MEVDEKRMLLSFPSFSRPPIFGLVSVVAHDRALPDVEIKTERDLSIGLLSCERGGRISRARVSEVARP